MQRFESTIYFKCPKCDDANRVDIEVPELDFSGESMSDHSSEGTVYFECPKCKTEFSGYAMCSGYECIITLEEYGLELQGDPPMYSPEDEADWSDYEIPDDPFGVFASTYEQTMDLLEFDHSTKNDAQVMPRMVFVQLISAMEAYLADTLISHVVKSKEKTNALLANDKDINKRSFSLREIAADEKLVEGHVRDYLRKIIYHNLGKVQFLYNAALGVDIKVSDEDWTHLHKAVLNRHDCVHRNGYSESGEKNDSFSVEYVKGTAAALKRMVEKIDTALSPF